MSINRPVGQFFTDCGRNYGVLHRPRKVVHRLWAAIPDAVDSCGHVCYNVLDTACFMERGVKDEADFSAE